MSKKVQSPYGSKNFINPFWRSAEHGKTSKTMPSAPWPTYSNDHILINETNQVTNSFQFNLINLNLAIKGSKGIYEQTLKPYAVFFKSEND